MRKTKIGRALLLIAILSAAFQCARENTVQKQQVKVDFDFDGRKLGEVHDPEYEPWLIGEAGDLKKEFGEITVQLNGDMQSGWYKTNIQAPHYARLVSDGLMATGELEMIIRGLLPGTHSLLSFHNRFDGQESTDISPVDIFVNGKKVEMVRPTHKSTSTIDAAMVYTRFHVKKDESVTVRFVSKEPGEKLVVNGFELDYPNKMKQARNPFPENNDEHVAADGNLTLKWESPGGNTSHQLYFGTSETAVQNAKTTSEEYKGEMDTNAYDVSDLYSMQTYYWRVDETDENGETTRGTVWSFRPAQLAFPGAEGYGRFAIGGRGGKVVEVTNLNDSGPGSLRYAVEEEKGPRTIVFRVSGEIRLKSRMIANDKYVTIAGQTAPGKGIVITRAPVGLTGDDCIMRFVRVRIGSGTTYDGMGLTGADHSIIDHCSVSWTIDEGFSSRGAHNITLQRTLISEALNVAGHDKYEKGKMHGYAATIGGDTGSFHHNLLAHNYGRNWSMGGGLSGDGYYTGRLDMRNNVVYNWGHRTTDGGAHEVVFENNYYKPGPATDLFYALTMDHEGVGKGIQRAYFSGNVMPGYFDENNQEKGRRSRISNGEIVDYETFVDQPFFKSYVTTQPARAAYKNVLSDVGANLPLDKHDQRILRETMDSTYTYKGKFSALGGMIDTEKDVGGLEDYPEEKRPADWDTDHDGLPDWWEKARGLNPDSGAGDFSDTNTDKNRDGFTELDHYLDWIAQPHYFVEAGGEASLNAKALFRGYREGPEYTIVNKENVSASVTEGKIRFKGAEKGMAYFEIQVKDASGDTMTRRVNVFVE